jgi:soluble lytic murein transglycosylase-like protein
MRQVDLDLFVNSASKGFNDGKNVPSPWAALLGGISDGIDQNYKNELAAAQTEQIRINNEMAPYEAKIREAQATEAELRQQAMEQDPQAFKDTIIKAQQAKAAEAERNAVLEKKRLDLTTIMDGDDDVKKGEAIVSGQYADVMTPELEKRYTEKSYNGWDPRDASLYDDMKRQQRSREVYDEITPAMTAKYSDNITELLGDKDFGDVLAKTKAASIADLLEKGILVTVPQYKQVPQYDTQGNPIMENGILKMGPPPKEELGQHATKKAEVEQVPKIKFGGELYDISKDSASIYAKTKTSYGVVKKILPGQDNPTGNTTDLTNRREQSESIKAAEKGRAEAEGRASIEEMKRNEEKFFAGYDAPARFKRAKASVMADRGVGPDTTSNPKLATNEKGETVPYVAPPVQTVPTNPQALTDDAFLNRSISTAESRQLPTMTKNMQSGNMEPTPSWMKVMNSKSMAREQAQAVKAKERYAKYGKTPENTTPVPPVQQAKDISQPSFKPEDINVVSSYKPDAAAVKVVAAVPELQNSSAIFNALITQESRGNPDAVSPTDVVGLAQVSEIALEDMGLLGIDRTDPLMSVIAGSLYFSKMENTFEGNPMLALTAYNGGEGIVKKAVTMAGTSDWGVVKKYLPRAVLSEDMREYWNRMGIVTEEQRKTKAREVAEYAERVIVNMPAFIRTQRDQDTAELLKRQGVFKF